jgi:hypothetical protein
MFKHSMILFVVATAFLGAAAVWAMPFNMSWHMKATGNAPMNRTGSEGLYGTGGRTDKGVKCSHCHIKGAGTIGVTVTAVPAFPVTGGDTRYVPGQRYTITVAMTGEHKANAMECTTCGMMNNKNSMALTIENASGARAGRFIADAGQDTNACPAANPYPNAGTTPAGKTTFMYGDCHAVLPLEHMGLVRWIFDWIAPAAGAGDLTIFVGVVDGDTGGHSSLDDDTVERALPLREGP